MLENINSKIEYITPWAASIVWWGLQLSTLDILNTAQCPNSPTKHPLHPPCTHRSTRCRSNVSVSQYLKWKFMISPLIDWNRWEMLRQMWNKKANLWKEARGLTNEQMLKFLWAVKSISYQIRDTNTSGGSDRILGSSWPLRPWFIMDNKANNKSS